MKEDWLIPVQNEINTIFENNPNMNDAAELSALINILRYIEDETNGLIKRLNGKLHEAEDCLREYHETNDSDFVQMAYDLYTHCQKLIEMATEKGYDISNQKRSMLDIKDKISKLEE